MANGKTIGLLAAVAVVAVGAYAFMAKNSEKTAKTAQGVEAAAGEEISIEEEATKAFAADDIEAGNPVVAKVDGKEITRVDVYNYVKTLPENIRHMPPQAVYPLALDQVINSKLIQNKADMAGLQSDEEVQQQIAHITEQIIRGVYIQRTIDEQITDDRLNKAYQDYVAKMGDVEERRARHILVADEAKAKEIIAKVKKGESFEDLAKANSTGPTGANGGDLGWFAKGDMVPEFSEAAYAMEKGAVSDMPVKTQFGYHVIKVEDVRKQEKPDYDAVKPFLQVQLRKEILEKLVADWREEATIERFDINGQPIEPSAGGESAAESN